MNRNNVLLLIAAIIVAVIVLSLRGSSKGTEIIKYDNGLIAVFNQDKNSQVFCAFVYVRAGAIDEKQPNQSGLSHFLEHMMFKGSANYPQGLFSAIEAFGGEMNASTGKQFTNYFINAPKENAQEIIKMLADAMQNPLFPQETVDVERNVIIEELYLRRGWTDFRLAEAIEEALYKGSAMENNVGGNPSTILKAEREDLFDYYNKHYIPSQMVVSVSGNFNMSKIKKLVANSFGKFESKPAQAEPNLEIKNLKAKDSIIRSDISAGVLSYAFLAPGIKDDEYIQAELLGQVLYLYMSRTLEVRFNLVNYISLSYDALLGPGGFFITASFDPVNYKEVKAEIERQLDYLLNNEIPSADLERAKLSIKTEKNFTSQVQSSIANYNAYYALMQRPEFIDIDLFLSEIEAVSALDIKNLLNKYYSKNKAVSITMLPRGEK
ncbi:MAG: insulinase family protein [Elusimicrobiota bacterium]|nr:insulinase family protein [Elusimicrobiota bacterium]